MGWQGSGNVPVDILTGGPNVLAPNLFGGGVGGKCPRSHFVWLVLCCIVQLFGAVLSTIHVYVFCGCK